MLFFVLSEIGGNIAFAACRLDFFLIQHGSQATDDCLRNEFESKKLPLFQIFDFCP